MNKKDFLSPISLLIVFFVIFIVASSVYLHVSVQSPHYHIVEKIMFSVYFTVLTGIVISVGFGLLVLVFSGVFRAVQKSLGIENDKAGNMPVL